MMPGSAASAARAIDQRMALAREWDELVQQARELDEDFLKPPRLERLLPAAADGPVVIVNVSRWRCDALIVTAGGVKVEKLGGLTVEAATAQARGYLEGLHEVEMAAGLVYEARHCLDSAGNRLEAIAAYTAAKQVFQDAADRCEYMLLEVTWWLWDHIASPVLRALGIDGPPEPGRPWPRLWWCPTGPLSLLPLHAAGRYTPRGPLGNESVLDRVVPSYTPTLRALLQARGNAPTEVTAGQRTESGAERVSADPPGQRILIVTLEETPGQMPLPNVARERRLLTRLFADGHTILDGPAATWSAVREQLPGHSMVHFSCHGDQELVNPSHGGIMLYDRRLTIGEISAGQYHGDFAFLSACKTATGGVTLPDEAITLAAALHYTGYRHVIGTLWSIHDQTAAEVTEAVYTYLTSTGTFEPGRAAQALHTAVRSLRDAGKPLSQWTPFTHTGP